jgi:hypothetical protein
MTKAQRVQLTRAKVVMDTVQYIIGRSYAEITKLRISYASRLFNQVYIERLGTLDSTHDLLKCV